MASALLQCTRFVPALVNLMNKPSMRIASDKRPDHILVVEGELATRNVLSGFLAGRGYDASSAGLDDAVPRFENNRPAAVILNLSGRTAIEAAGFAVIAEIDSALRGPRGNLERFVWARRAGQGSATASKTQ